MSGATEPSAIAHGVTAAAVTRGDGIDAWHFACVAVVDRGGRVTHALGDPELVTLTRSAIKPFQALPLGLAGGWDALGIDAEEIALTAGSHDGSDLHRAVAERLLAKAGAAPSALQCGAHWPLGMRVPDRYPAAGEDHDPVRNNCSRKHAGFLALARVLGEAPGRYLEGTSAVQRAVKRAVADACEIDEARLVTGVDGCGAPNFAMSLSALARGIKNLASRGETGNTGNTGSPGSSGIAFDGALARVRGAMQAHTLMVSGPRRFDYQLMRAFDGRVVCKVGAEGLQAIGFSDPPLGVVVKILDGGDRALAPISLAVLDQLGLLAGPLPPGLAERVRPVIRNHLGTPTGEVVANPDLRRL